MKQNSDNFTRIKQFLDNEMSLEERNIFEDEMRTNDELRAEISEQKILASGLYTIERDRLKAETLGWMDISKTSSSMDSASIDATTPKSNSISIARLLGMAASFLLLACLGYFLFFNKSQNPQEIVNTHLAMYHQDPVVLRSGPANQAWSDAIKHYRNRDFDKMINIMKDDVYAKNVNIEQLFYYGLAHLYQEPAQLDSAFHYLSKTKVAYNLSFHNEAAWYEALIFMKKGDTASAIPLLEKLVDSKDTYANKASNLLKSINK